MISEESKDDFEWGICDVESSLRTTTQNLRKTNAGSPLSDLMLQ